MRLYDESEIGAILKRTAELSKDVEIQKADGLSLNELKQLASEAGLDPELVVRAATELSYGDSKTGKRDIFGGPLSHSMELDLDVEIDQDTWEQMLPAIRSYFKDPGIVQTRKGVFEWTCAGSFFTNKAHVSIHTVNGGSRLHIFWSELTSAIPFFIPTYLSLLLSPAILFESLGLGFEGVPIWAFIVASFFLLSRFGVSSMKKRHVQKLEVFGKELTQIALLKKPEQHSDIESIPTEATQKVGPSIDIPEDEFEDRDESRGTTSERELL